MDSVVFEIIFIGILVLTNGALSMAELAVVSANRGRLSAAAANGDRRAKIALSLSENSAEFLATVQVGITLIGILAGVFGGATIAEDLSLALSSLGIRGQIADTISFAGVVGSITFLSVVIGELVPKQIALAHPERVALIASPALACLARFCKPVVWLLEKSSLVATALLPFKTGKQIAVSDEDIGHYIAQGVDSGDITKEEKNIAMRVFRLDDRPIGAFMTRRSDVVWLDASVSIDENWKIAMSAPHSFFPVADKELDAVLGLVSVKDLFEVYYSQSPASIHDVVRPPLIVPETVNALSVLEEFKKQRRQIALVVDEHGGVSGVVTTHDLLEAMVGDLADYEGEAHSIIARPDGSLLVDATVDLQELLLHIGGDTAQLGGSQEYHSVGGLVFGLSQSLPREGMRVEWHNLSLEVIDMDGHRIDKVLVTKLDPPASGATGT